MKATQKVILPDLIILALALVTIIIGVFSYLAPPAIFPDPSWGFQVMRSMEMGGNFNFLISPNPNNIAQNTSEFISWWSPGQYLMPYFFKSTLGINMGQAAVVTTTVCQLLGLWGFYTLFKKAGFRPIIAAISVAFIACQQFYYIPYSFYNGGEVLLFAFAGWFLYGCFSFRKINVGMLLFILLAGWAGFFCKSSMMWIYASGLLCLWINISYHEKTLWPWIKNGIWMAPPALLSIAGIYVFYLSKGENPASEHLGLKLVWETFSFPLASPLLSGFSIDDLTHGLIYHPDGPMFSPAWTIIILLLCALISVVLVISIIKQAPSKQYQILIAVFYAVSVLFFGYAFLMQLAISYEGRHFRIIGLLVIPGTIYLLSQAKYIYQTAFGLVWAGITFSSFVRLKNDYVYNRDYGIHGNSGLTQQFIDQPTLNYILQLDKQHRNAIFVFISADLGLEIKNNRFVTIEPIGMDIKIDYKDYLHKGHAGPLYIMLPSDYEDDSRAQYIMHCFPGYKNFKTVRLTEDYTLFMAN